MFSDEDQAGPEALRLQLPSDRRCVPEARRWISDRLLELGLDGVDETVALVANELVTNAVIHTDGDVAVVIAMDGTLRLEVHDHGLGVPVMRHPSPTTAGGRGLHIVDRLASRWDHGVSPLAHAKVVWAEFDQEDLATLWND